MGPLKTMTDARPKAWHALRVPSILSLPRTPAMRRARSQPGKDGRGLFCEPPSPPTSSVLRYFIHLLSCQSKIPTYSRPREFVWVVASPPRWHGPQVRAPWHHEGNGAVDVVGPMAPARSRERPWVRRSVHRSAKTGSRRNHRSHAECALWSRLTRKMRLSVTSPAQSAPFGHVAVASLVQNALFREAAGADCAFT